MNKIKILPIIFSFGLLFGSFGLTGAAKPQKITKVEQNSKVKNVNKDNKKIKKNVKASEKANYAYGFQFDYCFKNAGMEKNYGKQENPAKESGEFDENKIFNKTNVNHALALTIMARELIGKIKDEGIKKSEDFYVELLGGANLIAPFKKIQVYGTTEGFYGKDGLTKGQINEFERVLTKENFKKVEITKEKLEQVKKWIIPILEEGSKGYEKTKNTDSNYVNYARNLKNHIKEIRDAKLEDVKKAAKNFADCKMRIDKFDPSKAKG